ncbi:unnamed protein product [Rotaria sordida]|uniref:Uncharacterized protein n=1 Tax=Rotaria sordida TaxID=392033 RepID=A0A818VJX0_9BILA|nr:unnamed protein product [Rotaria sordida]CAF1114863.1 unnamed protein product [Rotaria sordida]CAF3698985.1 unnamed protein product [Rotaria sordida]CAF3707847.1 unnamed protein product [Rotaria sordida]
MQSADKKPKCGIIHSSTTTSTIAKFSEITEPGITACCSSVKPSESLSSSSSSTMAVTRDISLIPSGISRSAKGLPTQVELSSYKANKDNWSF